MEKKELYPEHERLIKEAKEVDKLLIRMVSSKAFHNMDFFLRRLDTEKIINIVNNLDRNDPKQLKLLIKYKKARKIILTNFQNALKEYTKFEKRCKNARRRTING